jgi:hypothetical protein
MAIAETRSHAALDKPRLLDMYERMVMTGGVSSAINPQAIK